MNIQWLLLLLSTLTIGCNQASDNAKLNGAGEGVCISTVSGDTTNGASYQAMRGALLGTRFSSLDELKSVIQIEYYRGAATSDSTAADDAFVRVRHCSHGREVIAVLATGTSQGDIFKARYSGIIWDKINLLFSCPYVLINRKDLERAFLLSRYMPDRFGEGDPAFYYIAESAVKNINTPDLAFKNTRDSTEKGYLNTFNHITAQAFITSCFSEELGDFIGDAHERYRHPELITGIFTESLMNDLDEGPVDNYVDIINNEWGQEIGKQLKAQFGITRETNWTPELMANYLNGLQSYYSWAFQIGFEPYRPDDEIVLRFSKKVDAVMKGRLNYN